MLLLAGAIAADPGVGVATPDLEILKTWRAGGDLREMPSDPTHLVKPGHLLLLRTALPRGGTPEELRRLLVVQAFWVWFGGAALCLVLWFRGRRAQGVILAALFVACLPLRDACDWIATEPFAIGAVSLFGAALVLVPARSAAALVAIGIGCAILLLVRPNLGATLLLVTLVFVVAGSARRVPRAALLLAAFAAGTALLALVGRATGLPLDPGSMTATKSVLYGTAEYLWPPDLEIGRASGPARVPEEAFLDAAGRRWRDFFARFGPDERRSLLWRLTHPILSTEQYPSRWRQPKYFAASGFVRRWWWLVGIVLASLAVGCAVAGRGEWRWIPSVLLAVIGGQALVFGAETRFVLPLLPVLSLAIVLALRTLGPSAAAGTAAALTALALGTAAWAVPDAVVSDYAVIPPSGVVGQRVPGDAFRGGDQKALHLRILATTPEVGLEVRGNGELLLRRSPGGGGPHPAYLTAELSGASLEKARAGGLDLAVRSLGDPGGRGFLYFPVVPDVFAPVARLNGRRELPSGFGGTTSGSFPTWTHTLSGYEPIR